MTEEKRTIELKYANLLGGRGEIYSIENEGKKHYFMSIEIDEEKAMNYLKKPAEFIAVIDGSSAEWEREKKIV